MFSPPPPPPIRHFRERDGSCSAYDIRATRLENRTQERLSAALRVAAGKVRPVHPAFQTHHQHQQGLRVADKLLLRVQVLIGRSVGRFLLESPNYFNCGREFDMIQKC